MTDRCRFEIVIFSYIAGCNLLEAKQSCERISSRHHTCFHIRYKFLSKLFIDASRFLTNFHRTYYIDLFGEIHDIFGLGLEGNLKKTLLEVVLILKSNYFLGGNVSAYWLQNGIPAAERCK